MFFYAINNIEASSYSDQKEIFGDNRKLDPPDTIPNSEVKRFYADDNVFM